MEEERRNTTEDKHKRTSRAWKNGAGEAPSSEGAEASEKAGTIQKLSEAAFRIKRDGFAAWGTRCKVKDE